MNVASCKKKTDHNCLIEPRMNEKVWGGWIRPAVGNDLGLDARLQYAH